MFARDHFFAEHMAQHGNQFDRSLSGPAHKARWKSLAARTLLTSRGEGMHLFHVHFNTARGDFLELHWPK
eukprot:10433585-Alexandrium_andersonii.AAC.1